ncbi:MAG TPA: MlaD family protein [Thermodesulfobacteriota bacterium]|nr:MlaD family protein [Thermodesulfobacteriota bacterium]
MSDKIDPMDFPQAVPVRKKRFRFSVVWFIPLLAAAVALGIAVESYLSKGPTITIVFKEAEGLEAGKTYVKYKDIHIGQVSKVRLSDDYSKIEVTAKIDKSAENLIVEDSKFWVMRPQISLSGISGIGTILSGNYIGIDPGKSKNKSRHFVGVEVPPPVVSGQPGREFMLKADDLGSVGIGTPVYYRRLNVGQVTAFDLGKDGKSFDIKIFVHAPYDKHVSSDTRFWQASGVDVSMGATGLTVRTQSLVSVLVGGIAFESPPGVEASEPAAKDAVFKLYGDRVTAFAKVETQVQYYRAHFNESLRGLSVGAPVSFLGMPVGEVVETGLEFNPKTYGLRPQVKMALYADRLVTYLPKGQDASGLPKTQKDRQAFVQRLVERGLRAQLQTGSFVSGQLFVGLQYFPNAAKASIDWSQDPPEMPVVPGDLASFQDKLLTILTKIEQLPIEDLTRDVKKVLVNLDKGLADVNRMVTNVDGQVQEIMPEVKKTLGSLDRALKDADTILVRADQELVPGVKSTLGSLQATVESAQRVLANTDTALLGPDAPAQQELRDTLQELSRAARGIRLISEYFERHPESLIRGKAAQEKP